MASNPQLRVPKEQSAGLARLLALSEEQFSELEAALRETPATLWRREYAANVATRLQSIDRSDLDAIISVLLTLYLVRGDAGQPVTAFVEAIREAVALSDDEALRRVKVDWSVQQERLRRLLDLEHSLGVVAKVGYLAGEHTHALHSAELFTDLRPIFRNNPGARPVAAIISHQLKITYHRGGDLDEFYVALSTENIALFRKLLDRAEAKARSLREMIESTAVPVLGEGNGGGTVSDTP